MILNQNDEIVTFVSIDAVEWFASIIRRHVLGFEYDFAAIVSDPKNKIPIFTVRVRCEVCIGVQKVYSRNRFTFAYIHIFQIIRFGLIGFEFRSVNGYACRFVTEIEW